MDHPCLVGFEETVKLLAPIFERQVEPQKEMEGRKYAQNLGALRALANRPN